MDKHRHIPNSLEEWINDPNALPIFSDDEVAKRVFEQAKKYLMTYKSDTSQYDGWEGDLVN